MPRILAIDYGTKRTGLAITDPLCIIATALETIETSKLIPYLKKYFLTEEVLEVVIGMPKKLNNQDSEMSWRVRDFIEMYNQNFPEKPISVIDERFTSALAERTMIDGGMLKKNRKIKGNVDKISATLILQSYLQTKNQ